MKKTIALATGVLLASAPYAAAKNPIWQETAHPRAETTDQTPLFTNQQTYLEAAPTGVGAKDAWNIKGGTGENTKVVDIEVSYQIPQEDLNTPFYDGGNALSAGYPDHGTSVWGEIAAINDDKGVTGIAYGASYGVFGFAEGAQDDVDQAYIDGINAAIKGAMSQLHASDVMVIEQEMSGPDGDTSVDYWPEIRNQLKAAADQGILCVEAAGNGNSNLDAAAYNGAFDLNQFDSGCIMVGAADPVSHERMDFSNYGSRVDAYGYGTNVTTTGYGDLFNGGVTRTYTSSFNGTSSATPIVAGAVAVISSIAKAQGHVLTPTEVRAALRATGTAQGSQTSPERIGTLPNIAALVQFLGLKNN